MSVKWVDTPLPSEGTSTASQYEVQQLQLPLTPNILQEVSRLFQEHLAVTSEVLISRGVVLLNVNVAIKYPTTHQNSASFVLPGPSPMATGIDVPAENDEDFETTTDTPAPPVPDEEVDGQAIENLPVELITTAETDSEVGEDEDENEDNDKDKDKDEDEDVAGDNAAATPQGAQCKICMDDLALDAIVRINCGCVYCSTCLNDHIMHGLSSRANYPARCCDREGIDIGDVSPYLNDEVIMRWSEVEAEYKERLPMYCQNKECSAHIPASRLGVDSKFIDCNSCHTDTCKECKQWRFDHGGKEMEVCPEDIVSKEDRELADSEKWKQCPGCKNLVERMDGCNNMQCECSTEFCYDCGVEYSPDHRCGCETTADQDGWHYREGEMPEDLGDEEGDEEDYIDVLAGLLGRVHQSAHGPFADVDAAVLWLREHAEDNMIIWDGLDPGEFVGWQELDVEDGEAAAVFQTYERLMRPGGGW